MRVWEQLQHVMHAFFELLGVLLLQVQSGTRGPGISTGIAATTCTSISVITISTTVKLLFFSFFTTILTGEHRRHGSYQPYKSVP